MPNTQKDVLSRRDIRFLLAVGAVAVAFLWRVAMVRAFGAELPPFITFYPAVVLVAIVAGLWPGILATALAALVADYFIVSPRGSFAIASTADVVQLLIFTFTNVCISAVAERYRRGQQRIAAYEKDLALKESEEQFRILANAIPQLCWMANADGWVFWYNQRWYDYTGTTAQQMEGWGWQSVHDPEVLPKVLEQWKSSIVTRQPFDMVFPLRGADGVFRPFLTQVVPVKNTDGSVVRWFGTSTDITELRNVEDALWVSEERLSLVMDAAGLGTWDRDIVRDRHVWSARAYTLFGVADDTPINYRRFLEAVHPEDRQRVDGAVRTAIERHEDYDVEMRTIWPDGSLHWISSKGRAFYDSSGQPLRMIGAVLDITESKVAEEALKESESRFRLLTDSAPALIWMSGTDKLCTYFNKPWLNFTGRPLESELGNGWAEGVHSEDFQRCLNTYTQAFERREEFRMEYRLRRHDGEYRWIFDIGVPRFDQSRSFLGYIGIAIDVTERKLADEIRFRHAAIVESSDDAIVGMDTDGTVANWNKAAERLYGYSANEAIGTNISFLSAADRLDEVSTVMNKVLKGEVLRQFETVRQRKDGTRVEVSLTVSPIVDAEGRIVGASGIGRDITERKLVEEALRESEDRLRLFVEHAPAALAMFDRDMRYLRVSRRWLSVYGLDGRDLIGMSHYDVFREIPEHWKQAHRRGLAGEVLRGEDRFDRLSGATTWIRWEVRPWHDTTGKIGGIVIFSEDVTERQHAQESLRLQSEQLRALSTRLQQVREEERTMVARDLHDQLGQILTAVKIDTTWISRHLPEAHGELQDRIERTIELINDGVRSVRKICSGLRPGILDDLGLVAAIEWQASEFASATGIDCQVSVPPADLPLDGDRATALFRIFQESLTNVSRHAEARAVRVFLYQQNGNLMLVVEDDGKGFREADVSGSLGLLGMKERAQVCGGDVQVSSTPGEGTRVTVRIPCTACAEREQDHAHPDSR
jgi:PAS domain S-box-containing protein